MARIVAILCLLTLASVTLTACEDEAKNGNNTPIATSPTEGVPTIDENATPITPAVSFNTPEPVETQFGRDPVTADSLSAGPVPVSLAETGSPDIEGTETRFDRMTFQFDDDHPAYEIQYVPGPIQNCASGEHEEIAGNAFLQIRFTPAVAHDVQGNQTVSPTDLQPALPAIQQAKQVCDFEGVVTWVLGLSAETDFRVFTVLDQIMVIDILQP
jgi:hypothetical protein